jgi:hypothetical protein
MGFWVQWPLDDAIRAAEGRGDRPGCAAEDYEMWYRD